MIYTAKEISHRTPSEIAAVLTSLVSRNDALEPRLKELERKAGLTSKNSSKPPSSDGLRKPKSMRKSGGKKGAPKDHDGYTLQMTDEPDPSSGI